MSAAATARACGTEAVSYAVAPASLLLESIIAEAVAPNLLESIIAETERPALPDVYVRVKKCTICGKVGRLDPVCFLEGAIVWIEERKKE